MPVLSRFAARPSVLSLAIPLFAALIVGLGCGDDKSGNGGASGPRFDPDEITIVVGDTIRFVATSGDHTVTSGTGAQDPNSGRLFNADLPEGDEFRHVFNTPGTFDYYCIPHEADGMVGTVTVEAAEPKIVDVFVSGVTFNPEVVTINPGDQVRWTVNGSHTITSGTGPTDPNAGDRFDETVNTGSVITATFNDLGSIPYFCQLHFAMGMTGTINVVPRTTKTVEVEALN
jgi:plastocyanin